LRNNLNEKASLGVIIGNRDFFPDRLVTEARIDILKVFETLNLKPIMLDEQSSKLGGVETFNDAQKCVTLFKLHEQEIIGVLVVLPNFGDEPGVAETLKLAGLNAPVLMQAYPDDLTKLDLARRRDAWCGKISACNNLYQFGIKYSITAKHVINRLEKLSGNLNEYYSIRIDDQWRIISKWKESNSFDVTIVDYH
jgi:L-fucose isomerase-like protein